MYVNNVYFFVIFLNLLDVLMYVLGFFLIFNFVKLCFLIDIDCF